MFGARTRRCPAWIAVAFTALAMLAGPQAVGATGAPEHGLRHAGVGRRAAGGVLAGAGHLQPGRVPQARLLGVDRRLRTTQFRSRSLMKRSLRRRGEQPMTVEGGTPSPTDEELAITRRK